MQATDVTDARLAKCTLRASESKFAAIANSIDQMIWSTKPDGYHDYYNDRWYGFTGVPYGTTDGEAWNGLFHADDQKRAWQTWEDCLRTGDPYHIESRLRHHSGEYRWVIGRAQCVRNDLGDITRWFGACTDIHDLKSVEEQLAKQTMSMRESEEFSRSVVESSPDCITVLNLDGTIQFMNENGRLMRQEKGASGTPKGVAREGFGAKLARATATGQLSGTIVYDWRPDGVKIAITAPLERLQA